MATPRPTEHAGDGPVIRPGIEAWRTSLAPPAFSLAKRSIDFRLQLGLPTDRPLSLSGHQAQVWHPGILAKVLALDAAAGSMGCGTGWIVVDHDDNDPFLLRAPAFDAAGQLVAASLGPPHDPSLEHVPACRRSTWTPAAELLLPEGNRAAAATIEPGLARIRSALVATTDAPSAAQQVARAVHSLLGGLVDAPPYVLATRIAATDLFAWIIDRMRSNPVACIEAHNSAVAAHPHERIAPLAIDSTGQGNHELPLWEIGPAMGSPRQRVRVRDLGRFGPESLAPRALLMTGLLRLAGCELFVHGLGGERYDRITDLWFSKWLGEKLSPTAMVTATLRLPIPGEWPAPEDIARATWTAHHARHDPALIGNADAAAAKRRLVERVHALPRKSPERARLFGELQQLLQSVRANRAAQLEAINKHAAAARASQRSALIAADRTWPFPLYDPAALLELRAKVRGEVGLPA